MRNNLFAFCSSYTLNVRAQKLNRRPESIHLDGNLYRPGDGAPGQSHLDEW